jgi:cysteine synthase A
VDLIGNTPLVRIRRLAGEGCATILAKLEKYNPGGSIKDRVAKYMIEAAEREGRLKEGTVIIEPTSGNTGIALAMVAAAKGYRVKAVMPESMSIERAKIMRAFGAEPIFVRHEEWRDAAISLAKRLPRRTDTSCRTNSRTAPTSWRIMRPPGGRSWSKPAGTSTRSSRAWGGG